MTAALSPQATPRELIPGNPESADTLGVMLERYAQGLGDGATQLRGLENGPWAGPAATSFRARLGTLPARMGTGSEVLGPSGRALRQYAATLREGQAQAGRAIELAREAERQSAHYQNQLEAYQQALTSGDPTVPAPPATDPGAETMAQAERILAEARARVEESDAYTGNILRAAAEQAPTQPSFWHHLWWGTKQFFIGFKESVVGTGKFLYHLSPTYAATHPVQAGLFYRRLKQNLWYGVRHPVAFGKAMVDWETWQENPARALGHLGPDMILGAATGGAAVAAKGGLRGMRSVQKLQEGREAARLAPDKGSIGRRVPDKAHEILQHIDEKGSPPYRHKGGRTYENDPPPGKPVLPKTDSDGNPITYREWDVEPDVKGTDRTRERIVTGSDGSAYYTDDHYDSFTRIR